MRKKLADPVLMRIGLNIVRAHGKMSLTVYGIHNYPHDFAVTKVNAPLNQCTFLLDFSRKLERQRWLFRRNRWVGITVGLLVPVVHLGERHGGFVISLSRGEPYFTDIPKLWKQHFGTSSSRDIQQVDGLEIVADFGQHFPSDRS